MHINSRQFTKTKHSKGVSFSTFASDVQFKLEWIFEDSCDAGFVMVSERTGKELTFYLDREEKRDGDLVAWHFKPVTRDPALQGVTATVWND